MRPGLMTSALILYIGSFLDVPKLLYLVAQLPDVLTVPFMIVTRALFAVNFPNFALAAFAIRFPAGDAANRRVATRIVDAVVVAGLLFELVNANVSMMLPSALRGWQFGGTVSSALVLGASIFAYVKADAVERPRVRFVLVAIVLSSVLYAAVLALLFTGQRQSALWLAIPTVLIMPSAVAYAVFKHRLFDLTFVLNRTLAYALTSAIALLVLGILELLVERYISALGYAQSQAIEFGIALAVIVFARLIHQRVDRLVDNLFFRKRHENEAALRRFAITAQFFTELEPLARDALDAIECCAEVRGAAMYLASDDALRCAGSTFSDAARTIGSNDSAYVELRAHRDTLDLRGKNTDLPGTRAYPMVLAGRLVGAVAIADRETRESVPPDIDQALKAVAAAVGIAVAAIETAQVREENERLRLRLSTAPA